MRHTKLLKQVWSILRELPPEDTYLACLCLRNLSQEEPARDRLLHFQGSQTLAGDHLLALLEKLFVNFTPDVVQTGQIESTQGHALKWSASILRQVTSTNAALLVDYKYTLRCLLELIQHLSKHVPLYQWRKDSLPDSCLLVILNVAQTEDISILKELKAQEYLNELIGKGGIHDTRASWIQCTLEGL